MNVNMNVILIGIMNYNTNGNISMICLIYCLPLLPQVSSIPGTIGPVASWHDGMCGGCKPCVITPLYQCSPAHTGWEGPQTDGTDVNTGTSTELAIDCRHSSSSSSL